LCRAGELDRACSLLLNGREEKKLGKFDSSSSLKSSSKANSIGDSDFINLFHGEDDEFLDIGKDCTISKTESLSMGHAITVWLVEIMESASNNILKIDAGSIQDGEDEVDDQSCLYSLDRQECVTAYAWSLKACIEISKALLDLKKQLTCKSNNQLGFDSSLGGKSSLTTSQQRVGGALSSFGASPQAQQPGLLRSRDSTLSSASFATDSSLTALQNMNSLFLHYNLTLGWKRYHDRATKRACLRKASRAVFEHYTAMTKTSAPPSSRSDGTSHAHVYKLAELLGYERVTLSGILAEEACCCGDLKTAVLLCKVFVFTSI
jgi:hypothetical protein